MFCAISAFAREKAVVRQDHPNYAWEVFKAKSSMNAEGMKAPAEREARRNEFQETIRTEGGVDAGDGEALSLNI